MAYWLGFALYLPLVLLAVWLSWGAPGPRVVSAGLLAQWAAVNVAFFLLPTQIGPAILGVFATLIMLMVAHHGEITRWTSWHVALVVCCVTVLAAILAYCYVMLVNPTGEAMVNWQRLHVLEVTTNILFAAKCLITGAWGHAAGRRADFTDRAVSRRDHPQPIGQSKGGESEG